LPSPSASAVARLAALLLAVVAGLRERKREGEIEVGRREGEGRRGRLVEVVGGVSMSVMVLVSSCKPSSELLSEVEEREKWPFNFFLLLFTRSQLERLLDCPTLVYTPSQPSNMSSKSRKKVSPPPPIFITSPRSPSSLPLCRSS